MVPITRRHALQVAAGLLAGLAGCNDDSGADGPGRSPTRSVRRRDDVDRDPEYVQFRARESERGKPVVWFLENPDDRATGSDTVGSHDRLHHGFVASEERAATLTVADVDGLTVEGDDRTVDADGLRAFVAETDFDRETLYLEQRPVGECYRRVLCHVAWDGDEMETRYGEFFRDHDVACEADARDVLATVIRLPAALDPDAVRSGGSGVSRGDCFSPPGERGRQTPAAGRETASPADGDDPTTGGGNR